MHVVSLKGWRSWLCVAWCVVALGMGEGAAWGRVWVVQGSHARADDLAEGTADAPLRTIGGALKRIEGGDTVRIMPGTYREGALVVGVSGTADRPVVIEADRPGTVVIDGGGATAQTNEEYPIWLGPPGRDSERPDRWEGAAYVTVRGLVLRHARGTALAAGTGWRVEDCLIAGANYDGIVPRGDDIVIERTVVQGAGNNGIAGGFGRNIVVRDCIIRRCNQYPHEAGNTSGATKFLQTDGLRIENLISYDNFGSGLWLDWDNVRYSISGCTIFGNHAGLSWKSDGGVIDQPWAAPGIWTEGNRGPGRIAGNLIYSNVSSGIGVLESSNLVIEDNTIFDCGAAIELRDLNREGDTPEPYRLRRIANVTIRNNRFVAWREEAAVFTSVGEWKAGRRPRDYGVRLEGNRYAPGAKGTLIQWLGRRAQTLEGAREGLRVEARGIVKAVKPDVTALGTHSTGEAELRSGDAGRFRQVASAEAESESFDRALRGLRVGSVARLAVFGRSAMTGAAAERSCEAYDLAAHRAVRLHFAQAGEAAAVERRVPEHAVLKPVYLTVRLTRLEPYAVEAVVREGEGGK
jgi:parallel beta-helix repeat protein